MPLEESVARRRFARHRTEGHRLVSSSLQLQRPLLAKLRRLQRRLLHRRELAVCALHVVPTPSVECASCRSGGGPVLGVHLRGTDKGKYLATAGSGQQESHPHG